MNATVGRYAVLAVAAGLLAVSGVLMRGQDTDPSGDAPPGMRFEDVSAAAGVGGYLGQSYGSAWGDVDGNGLPDLWAGGHSAERLFVNQGTGRFRDEAGSRLREVRYSDRHGAAWGDFDADGDQDLLQTAGAGRGTGQDANALYLNTGGKLRDEASGFGIDYGKARTRAAAWFDLDGDRDLDVALACAERVDAPPAIFRLDSVAQRFARTPQTIVAGTELVQLASLASGQVHLLTGPPRRLRAFRVQRQGLTDVSSALRLDQLPGHSVADLLVADLDNDLRFDIVYVRGWIGPDAELGADGRTVRARLLVNPERTRASVSFRGPNKLSIAVSPRGGDWWRSEKVFLGHGAESPADLPFSVTADDAGAHGLAEGTSGLYLGFSEQTGTWTLELRGQKHDAANLSITGDRPIFDLASEGVKLVDKALEQFVQWNDPPGLTPPLADGLPRGNCTAGAAGDFDNDMDVDLYLVCTGNLSNRENLLLRNMGQRRFEPVPAASGAGGSLEGLGESVSVADYDADGRLDLFVRNGMELPPFGMGPDQLFRNISTPRHWIEIDLAGIESNPQGIGTLVMVTAGGVKQVRFAGGGVHGRVQDHGRLHFGLGGNRRAEEVVVEWPSGVKSIARDLEADRIWTISENGAAVPHAKTRGH